jgi:hypothetical protein
MVQIVSVVGSLLILLAYTANQTGRMTAEQTSYSLTNALGAGILAVVAAVEEQWGFLLLEGVWTIVSVAALVRAWR